MSIDPITDPKRKLRVLFVGAFQPAPGSTIRGGQLAACRAILASSLSDWVEWVLLDSTMESIPPPPAIRRARLAAVRFLRFVWLLATRRVDSALIFTSSDLSLLEKGAMAIVAKWWGKHVVLCPRSGFIIGEYRASRFTRIWLRLVLQHCDRVICQGRRWREFYAAISGCPRDTFQIIYNMVLEQNFSDEPLPDREQGRQALLMGWVERNKGIFDLLQVAERFRPELRDFRFVIAGNGQDWDEFNAEVKRLKLENHFEMLGWVDEDGRRAAIDRADICLMLSHREGMPNALLEAMAAGRPVVATAVGAVPDIVEEARTGFLCEPGDVDGIGFRILDLCRSRMLRQRLGNAGRAAVRSEMAQSVVWRQWLHAVTPAADGKRKPD